MAVEMTGSAGAWATDHPPSALAAGGVIAEATETWWRLRPARGPEVTVTFVDPLETRFVESGFSNIAVVEEHPVLQQYQEEWAGLYVSGAQAAAGAISECLSAQVEAATGGWRTVSEYAASGVDQLFTYGIGLLIEAPRRVVEAASLALVEFGVGTDVVPIHGSPHRLEGRNNPKPKALIMGRNFVVARSFRFQP